LSCGKAAANEQQPVLEVDVLPAQRKHLAEAKARVEQKAERVSVPAILPLADSELVRVDSPCPVAVPAALAGACECLDFFDLVVVKRSGWSSRRLSVPETGFDGSS